MKIAAPDLGELNLIDEVIVEPRGGAHNDHKEAAVSFRDAVLAQIKQVQELSTEEMLEQRYQKFRKYGEWNGETFA